MSDLTTELNLVLAVDGDDLADYLDVDTAPSLRTSLKTLDGLFNNATGHTHNGAHQGGSIGAISPGAIPDGSVTAPKLAPNAVTTPAIQDGAVTAAKLAAGVLSPEALFAGATVNTSVNYAVAAGVMFVFCSGNVTITLPAAASTNRPITVWSLNGTVTVAAAGGTVFGGSINLSTGAVTNGSIITGDAITYKSDQANWRAG